MYILRETTSRGYKKKQNVYLPVLVQKLLKALKIIYQNR